MKAIISTTVRLPDIVLGDLAAQYTACQTGARELRTVFEKYGADTANRYFSELLDYVERMTRKEISEWPDGTYCFTDYIDDDGVNQTPLPIRVAITVSGERLSVDYEGSSPQVEAALNATKSYTSSCTYLSVRSVLKGDIPNNAGVFRCIEVRAPQASILNPVMPAACAARALTGYRVFDAMLGALSQIVPERVPAAGEGGNTVVCIGGYRADKTPFIVVDMICGAWGGRPDKDGIEAITNPSQNLSNTPIETMEVRQPVRIEEYALIPDSGGAGKWRGGLGITRLIVYSATARCHSCALTVLNSAPMDYRGENPPHAAPTKSSTTGSGSGCPARSPATSRKATSCGMSRRVAVGLAIPVCVNPSSSPATYGTRRSHLSTP